MKVDLNIIESEFKLIESWNLTHRQKNLVYYPKDERELKWYNIAVFLFQCC